MSELDFSSTMSEAFEAASNAETSSAPTPETVTQTEQVATESPAPAPQKEAEGQVNETTDQGLTQTVEAAPQPIDPPSSWSADAKEHFAKLPPDLQAIVAKRESEREGLLTQKSQEFAEKNKAYEPIEQIIAPRRQVWAMNGMTEAQALNQLFALSDFASRTPEQFVQWFAGQHGIDLSKASGSDGEQHYVDPAIAAMQQKLYAIEQHTRNLENQRFQAAIDSFKAEPGHEYFEDVREHMAALLERKKAKDMEDAYDQAVWANPETRGKLLAAKEAEAEAKRLADAKEAAAKAKKAAGTRVNGNTSAPVSVVKGKTFLETMSAAYDNHVGAA